MSTLLSTSGVVSIPQLAYEKIKNEKNTQLSIHLQLSAIRKICGGNRDTPVHNGPDFWILPQQNPAHKDNLFTCINHQKRIPYHVCITTRIPCNKLQMDRISSLDWDGKI